MWRAEIYFREKHLSMDHFGAFVSEYCKDKSTALLQDFCVISEELFYTLPSIQASQIYVSQHLSLKTFAFGGFLSCILSWSCLCGLAFIPHFDTHYQCLLSAAPDMGLCVTCTAAVNVQATAPMAVLVFCHKDQRQLQHSPS